MRIAPDGEVQFRGPTLFKGYWDDARGDGRGVHRGRLVQDRRHRPPRLGGRLILSGRKKDIIVLPNGFNVYPEDIENALRIAGIRDSVVARDAPGRIEAVILPLEAVRKPTTRPRRDPRSSRRSTPRSRPRTRPSGRTSTSPPGAFGPSEDFPRTHTLKVKRDQVRTWAAVEATLPVSEGS